MSSPQIGLAGLVGRPYLANRSEDKYCSNPSPMTARLSPTETTRFHFLEGRATAEAEAEAEARG